MKKVLRMENEEKKRKQRSAFKQCQLEFKAVQLQFNWSLDCVQDSLKRFREAWISNNGGSNGEISNQEARPVTLSLLLIASCS